MRRYPFEEQDAEEEEGAGAASVRTAVGGWCGTARRPPLDPLPELTEQVKHRRDDQHEGRNWYRDPDTDEISPAPCYYLDGDWRAFSGLHRLSLRKEAKGPFRCDRTGPFALLPTTDMAVGMAVTRQFGTIAPTEALGKGGDRARHNLHRAFYLLEAQRVGAATSQEGGPTERARSGEIFLVVPCYPPDGGWRMGFTVHRPSPMKKLRPFPCHRIGPFALVRRQQVPGSETVRRSFGVFFCDPQTAKILIFQNLPCSTRFYKGELGRTRESLGEPALVTRRVDAPSAFRSKSFFVLDARERSRAFSPCRAKAEQGHTTGMNRALTQNRFDFGVFSSSHRQLKIIIFGCLRRYPRFCIGSRNASMLAFLATPK